MNLFLLGWHLPADLMARIADEMRGMTAVYPQLDANTLWCREFASGTIAASMHHAPKAAAPRRYRHTARGHLVLYDGSPIDRHGRFTACDARQLAEHWDALADSLDGQFVVARVADDPPRMEVLTDIVGMQQVYYVEHGGGCLVCNSVGLIDRLTRRAELDPLGTSLYLGMGWTGGDRTLRHDVRVIPAAQHWSWRPGLAGPERRAYYSYASLARRRQRRLTSVELSGLATALRDIFRRFERDYGPFWCAVTGGRDSRAIVALLLHAGTRTRYFTSGVPSSDDVVYARRIASDFGLPHEIRTQLPDAVLDGWDGAADRLVRQNDGMISLMQIADLLHQPTRVEELPLGIWGIGGGIARGYLTNPYFLHTRSSREATERHMLDILVARRSGLFTPVTLRATQEYVRRYAREAMDEGFAPRDVPVHFNLFELTRRWGGSNSRKAMPTGDRFSPFCTRAFVEATFGLPPSYRYAEWLHAQLIKRGSHDLFRLPITGHAWRSERPIVNMVGWLASVARRRALGPLPVPGERAARQSPRLPPAHDHAAWLEAKRDWFRALCLDQPQSALWNLVDRPVFERMTGATTDAAVRRLHLRALYAIATVFAYAASR